MNDDILSEELKDILNNSNNSLENVNRKNVNIDQVLKDRDKLNIFTLNRENYISELRDILLNYEKDIKSLEYNFNNIDIKKIKRKGKKVKKIKN